MAMKLGDFDDGDLEVNHDINVTPFIDVILVLLIIFMVAAPLATSDIPVRLPSSTAAARERPDKPIYVTLKQDKTLFVGEEQVSFEQLKNILDRLTNHNMREKIFIRGDEGVDYGSLMALLNQLRAGGYFKIGLVGLDRSMP